MLHFDETMMMSALYLINALS